MARATRSPGSNNDRKAKTNPPEDPVVTAKRLDVQIGLLPLLKVFSHPIVADWFKVPENFQTIASTALASVRRTLQSMAGRLRTATKRTTT